MLFLIGRRGGLKRGREEQGAGDAVTASVHFALSPPPASTAPIDYSDDTTFTAPDSSASVVDEDNVKFERERRHAEATAALDSANEARRQALVAQADAQLFSTMQWRSLLQLVLSSKKQTCCGIITSACVLPPI